MVRKLAILLLLVATAAASGCSQRTGPDLRAHPNDEQAREYLAHLVDLAQSSGIPSLCEHGTSNCVTSARDMGAALTVPSEPPQIVGSRDVPDDGQSQGGWALRVCGIDGAGHAYRNEILFFGTAEDFTAIEALYWVVGFQDHKEVAPTDQSMVPEWNSCPSGTT